jgi:galactose-1-phosphate uridylyltransferase
MWKKTSEWRNPKACEFCHEQYTPMSASQLWCDICAPNRFFMVLIRKFGMNKPAFDAMLAAQDGRCAICHVLFDPEHKPGEVHRKLFPCVDHDHVTNLPRGLLCLRCNTRLGGQGNELQWLAAATEYVIEHQHVLLDVKDPMAQDLLAEYARRQWAVDPELAGDLCQALAGAGYYRLALI